MRSWKYFCLFRRVTRSEKPSLSDQKQITFSKDEISVKILSINDKKRRNKYKKWIELILHCFYVEIPSFSMNINVFLSFLNGIWEFSLSSIWQQFQVNFRQLYVVLTMSPKFQFLIKLSFNLDPTKISKCCMIK